MPDCGVCALGDFMGFIYLYTGNGAGKTSNALGLALRSVGHGHKVIMIQFMKSWKNTGEFKIQTKLKNLYEVHLFGRKKWVDPKNPSPQDRKIARKGLEFAETALKEKPNLLILDEICLACAWKLLEVDEVVDLLKKIPSKTDVVLTGRNAPKELIDRADFVNEIVDVKHPKKIPATKGIQY